MYTYRGSPSTDIPLSLSISALREFIERDWEICQRQRRALARYYNALERTEKSIERHGAACTEEADRLLSFLLEGKYRPSATKES